MTTNTDVLDRAQASAPAAKPAIKRAKRKSATRGNVAPKPLHRHLSTCIAKHAERAASPKKATRRRAVSARTTRLSYCSHEVEVINVHELPAGSRIVAIFGSAHSVLQVGANGCVTEVQANGSPIGTAPYRIEGAQWPTPFEDGQPVSGLAVGRISKRRQYVTSTVEGRQLSCVVTGIIVQHPVV